MDFSNLSADAEVEGTDFRPDAPDIVPGRTLHADADFYAYQCGYRWEEESLEQSIKALKQTIQVARIMAGAEFIKLYLTMGDKGGRYETARVKEYQAQRVARPEGLTARVSELRQWMVDCVEPEVISSPSYTQEADDELTQAMHQAVVDGTEDLNPMWSMDKDLLMAPGIHMNPKTYELEQFPNGFGGCTLDISTSTKKVVGKGTSFFWHQLIMGDTADNIPGLPTFSVEVCERLWPTKSLLAAEQRLRSAKTSKQATLAKTALQRERAKIKPKSCGAVRTFAYLSKCRTDLECFVAVRNAYLDHYGHGEFVHTSWDGEDKRLTAGDMLLEQANLLWMRRTVDDTALKFIEEVVHI
jgi:hypothetical protein